MSPRIVNWTGRSDDDIRDYVRSFMEYRSKTPEMAGLVQRLVQTPLSKRAVYRLLRWSQSMFNGLKHATFYNMVLMPKDHIAVAAIEHPERRLFGPLTVWAPSDLETYLRRHYRNLRRVIPKEEQQNHRPDQLSFA